MSANIRDVAKKSGVSICTVSNVLHNKGRVGIATRQKVLKAIRELEYDPYSHIPLARNIKTKTLGLIMPNHRVAGNTFYGRGIQSIQEYTITKDYSTVIFSGHEILAKIREEGLSAKVVRNCEGLIVFYPLDDYTAYLDTYRELELPLVLVGRDRGIPGVPVVHADDYDGSRQLMEHLYRQGHRRIGFVGYIGAKWPYVQVRRRAYDDFLLEKDLVRDDRLVCNMDGSRGGGPIVEEWIDSDARGCGMPTAILTRDDNTAAQLITRLHKAGLRVPDDIAVAGFNNDELSGMYFPAITTMDVPVAKMCRYACKLIFDQLEGLEADAVDVKFKNRIIVRESTARTVQ